MANNSPLPHQNCAVCGSLRDSESAYQKYGWAENDTHLPAAVSNLKRLKDLKPNSSRSLELMQCPTCQTYYLYSTDYEYLVNGSEDEQHVIRLKPEQVAEYLERKAI